MRILVALDTTEKADAAVAAAAKLAKQVAGGGVEVVLVNVYSPWVDPAFSDAPTLEAQLQEVKAARQRLPRGEDRRICRGAEPGAGGAAGLARRPGKRGHRRVHRARGAAVRGGHRGRGQQARLWCGRAAAGDGRPGAAAAQSLPGAGGAPGRRRPGSGARAAEEGGRRGRPGAEQSASGGRSARRFADRGGLQPCPVVARVA